MVEAAVIIPHYNDTVRLARCLAALQQQLRPGVEVVVVDNASTESLSPVRAAYPELRIVTEIRKGAAEARNRGVAETTAPLILFLDCDCLPAPDWLAKALQLAPQAEVIGGRIDIFHETPPPRTGAQCFETVFAFNNRGYVEDQGFSVTANLVTRREVFLATGPFVHGLSEDLDWCRRATARGFRLIYADELQVSHPSRSDWPALARKWRRVTDELFGVNGHGRMARTKWTAKALAMPLSILIHAPRIINHPGLRNRRERARALTTLVRLRLTRMRWMLVQALRGR